MNVTSIYGKALWFFRSTTKRIFDDSLWSSVTQIDGRSRVSIPATSKAVNRTNGYAAYLKPPFFTQPTLALPVGPPVTQRTRLIQSYSNGTNPIRKAFVYAASQLVITSDGNPSPAPSLSTGNLLLVEGSTNNGPANISPVATPTYTGDITHIGGIGQAIVGRATSSSTQNIWFVGGNGSQFGATSTYTPKTGLGFVQITRNPDDTLSFTHHLVGTANLLFPSCCVIEGERYLDQLFYTGGMPSWTSLSNDTKIYDSSGTATTVTPCTDSMTKAACLSSPYPNVGDNQPSKHYIIVTGGLNSSRTDSQNKVWTYDPYLNSWGSNQPLIQARRDHQMANVTIATGLVSVLVVGGRSGVFSLGGQTGPGYAPIGVPLSSCELINGFASAPATNNCTPQRTGSMADARYAFGMTLVGDGRVLVCGGIGFNPNYPIPNANLNEFDYELTHCEIYDPTTGFWTPIQSMLEPHSYCVCQYVPEANKVYVYGGYASKIVEYLDLDTMQWHKSTWAMPNTIAVGSPFASQYGYMGIIGGGTYSAGTFTVNDNISTGSVWNGLRANVPEYARYDGLNAEWSVDGYDSNTDTLLLKSASLGDYSNTEVKWTDVTTTGTGTKFVIAKAVPSSDVDTVGPFTFDLTQPFAIGGTTLALNQEVFAGVSYNALTVTAGASLIGPGWLLFNYGYSSQEGPVRCFGSTDDFTLMIDAGHKFKNDLFAGSNVNVLFQRAAFEPSTPAGAFWLTASTSARAAAINILKDISAAGIELDITTRYPGDRALGGEGFPTQDNYKLSDIVEVFWER